MNPGQRNFNLIGCKNEYETKAHLNQCSVSVSELGKGWFEHEKSVYDEIQRNRERNNGRKRERKKGKRKKGRKRKRKKIPHARSMVGYLVRHCHLLCMEQCLFCALLVINAKLP